MTIALPAGFCPAAFTMMVNTVQRSFSSPYGGSVQVVDLMNDWWTASMTLPATTRPEKAAAIEAWLNSMRGMTQTVALYHFARQIPRGSLRGSPTCAAASVGAATLRISGTIGATLLIGDMLGVGGQLFQVAAAAKIGGAGYADVTMVNRVRKAIANGSAVTWNRPTALFRLSTRTGVQHMPGYAEGVSLDFIEDVSL